MSLIQEEEKKEEPQNRLHIAVLGAGSYGTAMATMAARKGHHVMLYARDPKQCEEINKERRNPKRLKEYRLPDNIIACNDVRIAVEKANIIIHCIPAQNTPDFIKEYKNVIPKKVPYVSTSKGIHVETKKLMSEILPELFIEESDYYLCYLSGPSFAKEIMDNHPMSVVVASEKKEYAQIVQHSLTSIHFRIYVTTDVIGVEIGGALKNPLAIGAGIVSGLGYGQSTIASLVTRGTVEIQRLAIAMGAKPDTLAGLAGFGDIMLTCLSPLSRNRTCGYIIGKDKLSVEEAEKKVGQVVEGVSTAKVVAELCNKYNLYMPLFNTLAYILNGSIKPDDAIYKVMSKPPDEEGFLLNGLN